MSIKVNEIFGPTVQGEGKNAGKPVAFLRLALCNLHCSWCDTKFTWSFVGESNDSEQYVRENEVHEMEVEDILQKLVVTGMSHLVISGGEPLLQHKQLVPLLRELKKLGWFAEVETNGTLVPGPEFLELIDQINCSPKLSNAGDPLKLRIKEKSLAQLAAIGKVNFKFVIQNAVDLNEALPLIDKFGMKEVRLMPECRTPEEMAAKEPWLKALCEERGFVYCTRLSILAGNKRGE